MVGWLDKCEWWADALAQAQQALTDAEALAKLAAAASAGATTKQQELAQELTKQQELESQLANEKQADDEAVQLANETQAIDEEASAAAATAETPGSRRWIE